MKWSINEPCPADWEKMKIGINARYCDSCSKNVQDFTDKSRAEILLYLLENKNERTCGRLRPDQFDFKREDLPILVTHLKETKHPNPFLILALVTLSLNACAQEPVVSPTHTVVNDSTKSGDPTIVGKIAPPDSITKKPIEITKGDICVEPLEPMILGEIVAVPEYQNKPLMYVDSMPQFPGGLEAMQQYFTRGLSDMTLSDKKMVLVEFVVDQQGKTYGVQIIDSVDNKLRKRLTHLIQYMPTWTPGIHEGQTVDVLMKLPVILR